MQSLSELIFHTSYFWNYGHPTDSWTTTLLRYKPYWLI